MMTMIKNEIEYIKFVCGMKEADDDFAAGKNPERLGCSGLAGAAKKFTRQNAEFNNIHRVLFSKRNYMSDLDSMLWSKKKEKLRVRLYIETKEFSRRDQFLLEKNTSQRLGDRLPLEKAFVEDLRDRENWTCYIILRVFGPQEFMKPANYLQNYHYLYNNREKIAKETRFIIDSYLQPSGHFDHIFEDYKGKELSAYDFYDFNCRHEHKWAGLPFKFGKKNAPPQNLAPAPMIAPKGDSSWKPEKSGDAPKKYRQTLEERKREAGQ